MICSRRIISTLYNQSALLRFVNNNKPRLLDNVIKQTICNSSAINNSTKIITYPSTSIAQTPVRYVSKSSKILAQTEKVIMKGEGDQGLNLDYDDMLKAQKDQTVLIVDVREDAEIKETGKLPGSIHVPMGQTANVLTNLSDEEFLDKFGKPKPTKDTKMIFSCRSGKRSATVQEEMIKLGYQKSYNYTGGWLDWESKQTPKA